jgi:hypothetical protein
VEAGQREGGSQLLLGGWVKPYTGQSFSCTGNQGLIRTRLGESAQRGPQEAC